MDMVKRRQNQKLPKQIANIYNGRKKERENIM